MITHTHGVIFSHKVWRKRWPRFFFPRLPPSLPPSARLTLGIKLQLLSFRSNNFMIV